MSVPGKAREAILMRDVDIATARLELAVGEEYHRGDPIPTIAQRHNITTPELRNILDRMGFDIPPSRNERQERARVAREDRLRRVSDLHAEGLPRRLIAAEVGVTLTQIHTDIQALRRRAQRDNEKEARSGA